MKTLKVEFAVDLMWSKWNISTHEHNTQAARFIFAVKYFR